MVVVTHVRRLMPMETSDPHPSRYARHLLPPGEGKYRRCMPPSRLTPRARSLRQSGGLAEERVWARLRDGAVDGWKIRRQHPVGPFVVDFACVPLKLVIEIDGGVHERDEVILRDHHRQAEIEALGWTVIRFTNAHALGEPWRIDDVIREHAKSLGL